MIRATTLAHEAANPQALKEKDKQQLPVFGFTARPGQQEPFFFTLLFLNAFSLKSGRTLMVLLILDNARATQNPINSIPKGSMCPKHNTHNSASKSGSHKGPLRFITYGALWEGSPAPGKGS